MGQSTGSTPHSPVPIPLPLPLPTGAKLDVPLLFGAPCVPPLPPPVPAGNPVPLPVPAAGKQDPSEALYVQPIEWQYAAVSAGVAGAAQFDPRSPPATQTPAVSPPVVQGSGSQHTPGLPSESVQS